MLALFLEVIYNDDLRGGFILNGGGVMSEDNFLQQSILAELQRIHETISAVDNKVDLMNVQTIRNEMAVETAHKRMDEYNISVAELTKVVAQHEALKNKGLGIFAFISFAFGTLGMAIAWIVNKLFLVGH